MEKMGDYGSSLVTNISYIWRVHSRFTELSSNWRRPPACYMTIATSSAPSVSLDLGLGPTADEAPGEHRFIVKYDTLTNDQSKYFLPSASKTGCVNPPLRPGNVEGNVQA